MELKDDGDNKAFDMKKFFNPGMQRLHQAIVHRALYPEEELPAVDASILEPYLMSEEVREKSESAVAQIKECFDLVEEKAIEEAVKTREAMTLQEQDLVEEDLGF